MAVIQGDAKNAMRKVAARDTDKPSLIPFFLMEFLKYGTAILVSYILYMFLSPYVVEIKEYAIWLLDLEE